MTLISYTYFVISGSLVNILTSIGVHALPNTCLVKQYISLLNIEYLSVIITYKPAIKPQYLNIFTPNPGFDQQEGFVIKHSAR